MFESSILSGFPEIEMSGYPRDVPDFALFEGQPVPIAEFLELLATYATTLRTYLDLTPDGPNHSDEAVQADAKRFGNLFQSSEAGRHLPAFDP